MSAKHTNGAKPKANRIPAADLHPDEKAVLYDEAVEQFNASQSNDMPQILPLWLWVRFVKYAVNTKFLEIDKAKVYRGKIMLKTQHDTNYCTIGRVPKSLRTTVEPETGETLIGTPEAIEAYQHAVERYKAASAALTDALDFKPEGFEFADEDEEADE